MDNFQRLFGAGPRGLIISIVLLIAAFYFKEMIGLPMIHSNHFLRIPIFIGSIALTLAMIVWSAKSLNPNQRGQELITTGAFRYFRHPLYAAFLNFFNFGLAIFLDNYIFIIWAVLQHFVWHINVITEEKMMENAFPNDYRNYCKMTGRFIPRICKST